MIKNGEQPQGGPQEDSCGEKNLDKYNANNTHEARHKS